MIKYIIHGEIVRGAARVANNAKKENWVRWLVPLAQSITNCRDTCDWVRDRDHVIFTKHKVGKKGDGQK